LAKVTFSVSTKKSQLGNSGLKLTFRLQSLDAQEIG
jgi:hypothetical protein